MLHKVYKQDFQLVVDACMILWASCYKGISHKWYKNMLDVSRESMYDNMNGKWWENNIEWPAIYRKTFLACHGYDGTKWLVPSLYPFGSVQTWQKICGFSLPYQPKILSYLALIMNLSQIFRISYKITYTSKVHDATHDVIIISKYV